MARRTTVILPFANIVLAICEKLAKNGYLSGVKKLDRDIEITLVYNDKRGALTEVKRISKPGRRVYVAKKDIRAVLGGKGLSILSTPVGILTNKEAREKNVGGELLCEVF